MLFLVVTALALLTGGHTGGQNVEWALEDCIERVLEEDTRIREARINLDNCRREAATALYDLLPAISVSIGNDFGWGRSVDMQELLIINNRMNYAASASVSAAVSSSDICGAISRHREEKYAALAGEESLKMTIAGVVAETASAYVEALYAQQALDICRTSCERTEARIAALRLRIGNGSGTMRELEDLELEYGSGMAALAEASGRSRKALLTLKNLLNLPPGEDMEIQPPAADFPNNPEVLRTLTESRAAEYGIRRAEMQLEVGRIRLKRARLAFLPSLTVSGGIGTYYGNTGTSVFKEQFRDNLNPSLGIRLTVPICDGSARIRELNGAKAGLEMLEAGLEKERRTHVAEVENDIADAESLLLCIEAAQAEVDAAMRTYDAAAARFDNGGMSALELSEAGNRLKVAQLALLQHKCRYILQIKALEYKYKTGLCE